MFSILAEAERKKRLGVFAEITIYASKRMRITGLVGVTEIKGHFYFS